MTTQTETAWFHPRTVAVTHEGQPWVAAQVKLDGWRMTVFQQGQGQQPIALGRDEELRKEFFGRFPRLLEHPTVRGFLDQAPPFSSMDCEIICEDQNRSDVTTALRDPSIPLRIIPFAFPYFGGEDVRTMSMSWAAARSRDMGLPFAEWWTETQLYDRFGASHLMPWERFRELVLDDCKAYGREGLILKAGGQANKWYKLKVERTLDAVVMGVRPGQGKYSGMVGALVLGAYDGYGNLAEVAACSGMTDSERAEMTQLWAQNKLFGRVAEVKYQMVGAQGRLLHPRFKRWREDKEAKACLQSQVGQ